MEFTKGWYVFPKIPEDELLSIWPIDFFSFTNNPLNSPGTPFSPFLTLSIDADKRSPSFIVNVVFVSPSVIGCPKAPNVLVSSW